MLDGEVGYPLWTIVINGAAWGNRHKSEADTIAEVEQHLARALAGDYGDPYKPHPTSSGWITRLKRAWGDDGKDLGWQPAPVTVCVYRGMNVNYRGTLVATWKAGVRS